MSNVIVDKNKIDILANAISCKSGEPVTMTLDDMVSAVDGIDTGGITPTGNIDITGAGVTDVTDYATATVPTVSPFVATTDESFFTNNGQRKWHIRPFTEVDVVEGDTAGYFEDGMRFLGDFYEKNAIASGTSITPTESAQTIGGNRVMMEGAVTVSAIPSSYVGSGITQRSSSDLSANTLTVTAPSGYYSSNATKTLTDANLVAGNIKKNVPIFGVTGSYEGGGGSVTQDENGYIVLPSTGGGGPSDDWKWYGTNATHLSHFLGTVALKDTDFATWTPSTTSTVIWSKTITESMPPSGYHNVVSVKFIFNPVYQTGTTVVSGGTKFLYCGCTQSYRVIGNIISNWENGVTGASGTTTLVSNYLFYKDANGVDKIYNGNGYGVYSTSLTSGYQANNSVSVKAQANDTYFTTSMLSALDQEQSTFTISIDTYIMPDAYESRTITQDILLDMYQHGLTQ